MSSPKDHSGWNFSTAWRQPAGTVARFPLHGARSAGRTRCYAHARPRSTFGADAFAVVAQFPDGEDEEALAAYRAGSGVDAVAGAEAVISHLVTREIGVPCAHAPALPPLDADSHVSPKSAAQELGCTFLSCVLVGLSQAPHLVPMERFSHPEVTFDNRRLVTVDDVNAVVVPANAFGGAAVMNLAARPDVLVIAVKCNKTTMNVPPSAVGIVGSKVVYAASYAEAAGFLAAHKAGIDIAALGTDVPRVRELREVPVWKYAS